MTRGDLYRADYAAGMRISDIARKHGVTRQAVSQQVNERLAKIVRAGRRRAKMRRGRIPRPYHCSKCGGLGHRKTTCDLWKVWAP